MKRGDQSGAINILLIPFILIVLFFIGASGFGYWAFTERQDYKNNSNQKVNAAVDEAIKAEDTKKDAQFAEAYKLPLKTYQGPATYGGIQLSYPKTWSGYVSEATGPTSVDGYFSPGVVPALQAKGSVFSLRVQVISQSYSSVLQQFSSLVNSKKVTIAPYTLPKVASVVGSRLEGEIVTNKQGTMIIMPLRDKTIKVWTESTQYNGDLNDIILPNFVFSP